MSDHQSVNACFRLKGRLAISGYRSVSGEIKGVYRGTGLFHVKGYACI